MNHKIISTLALAAATLLFSCKKNTYQPGGTGNGKANIVFSNNAGSGSLVLGQNYTNQHGDQFQVSMFKYYVSNVKLNGSTASYTEPNSYHLIDQNSPAGSSFQLN